MSFLEVEITDHLDLPSCVDITDHNPFRWPKPDNKVVNIFRKKNRGEKIKSGEIDISELPFIIGSQTKLDLADWAVMRFDIHFVENGKIDVSYNGYDNNMPWSFTSNYGVNLEDALKFYRDGLPSLDECSMIDKHIIIYTSVGGLYWFCKNTFVVL